MSTSKIDWGEISDDHSDSDKQLEKPKQQNHISHPQPLKDQIIKNDKIQNYQTQKPQTQYQDKPIKKLYPYQLKAELINKLRDLKSNQVYIFIFLDNYFTQDNLKEITYLNSYKKEKGYEICVTRQHAIQLITTKTQWRFSGSYKNQLDYNKGYNNTYSYENRDNIKKKYVEKKQYPQKQQTHEENLDNTNKYQYKKLKKMNSNNIDKNEQISSPRRKKQFLNNANDLGNFREKNKKQQDTEEIKQQKKLEQNNQIDKPKKNEETKDDYLLKSNKFEQKTLNNDEDIPNLRKLKSSGSNYQQNKKKSYIQKNDSYKYDYNKNNTRQKKKQYKLKQQQKPRSKYELKTQQAPNINQQKQVQPKTLIYQQKIPAADKDNKQCGGQSKQNLQSIGESLQQEKKSKQVEIKQPVQLNNSESFKNNIKQQSQVIKKVNNINTKSLIIQTKYEEPIQIKGNESVINTNAQIKSPIKKKKKQKQEGQINKIKTDFKKNNPFNAL